MPNCPCENEAATCVDAASPLTRVLAGGCVEIGLDFADSDTIDFGLTGAGELTGDVIVSPNADNILEALPNGLFVEDPDIPSTADIRCGNCAGITYNSGLDVGCTGLRLRSCAGPDCEGAVANRLWAPPPIESQWFTGSDPGTKFAPFTGGTIPASTGTNTGAFEDDGYVISSIPSLDNGSPAQGLTFNVENPWCSPAVFDYTVHPGVLVLQFPTLTSSWNMSVYRRTWKQDPSGNITEIVGERLRFTGNTQAATTAYVPITIPTIRERIVVIQPGDIWRFRFEVVIYIHSTHASTVNIINAPTLFFSGHLRTTHRHIGTTDVSDV